MPTYTKETALYDTGAIKTGIDGAAETATSYLTNVSGGGVMVHPAGDVTSGWRISSALELLKSGVTYIKAWLAGTNSDTPTVQIGVDNGGHSFIDSNGMRIYGGDGTQQIANIGYGDTNDEGTIKTSPYYTFGSRQSNSAIGSYSVVEGYNNSAQGVYNHAEGWETEAAHNASHAEGGNTHATNAYAHAEGYGTTASGQYSHAQGYWCEALKPYSTACGYKTVADGNSQFVVGSFNKLNSGKKFVVGDGSGPDARFDAFSVGNDGKIEVAERSLLTTRTVSVDNVSIVASASSAYSQQQIAVPSVTGYTPIGVIGWALGNASSGGNGSSWISVYQVYLTGDHVNFYVRNHMSSAAKVKLTATVLYANTGII